MRAWGLICTAGMTLGMLAACVTPAPVRVAAATCESPPVAFGSHRTRQRR
jgi:hypothetical protein